jgi:hypothetical protein
MLLITKISMKNMTDLKLKQLQRKTICYLKRITSPQLQRMHHSVLQFLFLMMRTMMRMKNPPMIMNLLMIRPYKISLQVILDQFH